MHDLNSALISCSLRKSPGPSGLRYEHWRLLHPKLLQALTSTLSQEFCKPEHSQELLRASQGYFTKQSRFSLATCLRRLATRPPILLHAPRLVLG
jgi:hypothetical protein